MIFIIGTIIHFVETQLYAMPWWRLTMLSSVMCMLGLLLGWIISGQEGSILTYTLMVIGCGLSAWWQGFRVRYA